MEKDNKNDHFNNPVVTILVLALLGLGGYILFSNKSETPPTPESTPTNSVITTVYTNTTANVRSCASPDCKILGTYEPNYGLDLTGGPYAGITDISQLPDWLLLNFPDGTSGYISKIVLSDHKSTEAQSNTVTTATTKATDLPAIVKEWRKSTAYVECYWDYANSTTWYQKESGSGFLAILGSTPTVITNKHVVNDPKYGLAQECDIGFPDNKNIYYSIDTIDTPAHSSQVFGQTINIPDNPAHGQINFTADGSDVAYLTGFREENMNKDLGVTAPISILNRAKSGRFSCAQEADIGEPLVVLGYPSYGSGAGTFVSIFSSLDVTATEGIISGKDAGYYTTSAKIEHGNSGGIAIDKNNDCYLGIPTASYTGQIESLGRILPASYVVQ